MCLSPPALSQPPLTVHTALHTGTTHQPSLNILVDTCTDTCGYMWIHMDTCTDCADVFKDQGVFVGHIENIKI